MSISKDVFSRYVRAFQLRELFNDMGWNNDRTNQPIIVNEQTYHISGIAEKSGFRILACVPADGVAPPERETRKKIERSVTKLFQEHLIIFSDSSKLSQIWQLAVRKAGLPTKVSETTWLLTQDPELLYQKTSGLFFTLDEEEKITIVDVTKRVSDNFQQNNETVTKKFYECFKKEHTSFLKFIEGISDKAKLDWYASLMLNRLMFCYFIQKQRFLDDNMDYLQDKLKECKAKKGKNKFYSFYRDFLLALFHKGLGSPQHSKGVENELGRIPYLNGGLFDEHEIEKEYDKIQINDQAFERLFGFFDEWNWHLDTREAATGRDINPDVIGYIFEKYINDRAQMGAYYTKEDITDYISKNCIIPWLFDEVKRNYPAAFAPDGWLWTSVKNSGTEYIYDAVKYGVPSTGGLFDDLPPEIQKGFIPELENKVVDGKGHYLWELRKDWNKPAPSDIALPTEIYREVIERRKRYADVNGKIENGEITEINDFITYNLNIRQFAQDVIEDTSDPDFIRHFYKALSSVTILDPTCGSGAFLFAALNILEPLYETCIQRMQEFVSESGKGKYKFFEDTLKTVNAPEHPNLQYFIYKSIILNNLYGVDIMNEAVEIAKLRLFLKLVATVEADYRKDNLGLEPLPDVDFNIRAGNTLVGYATKKQIDEIAGMFVTEAHKKKILEQCDVVARAFERYKEIQLKGGDDYRGFKKAKEELNDRLKKLTDDLDKVCFIDQYKGDERDAKGFQKWLETHKPFHWFAEYYEIVQGRKAHSTGSGQGFDVVIGNPPYVEMKDVCEYTPLGYETTACGDLYSLCMERGYTLLSSDSFFGMIVPISVFGTDGFGDLQRTTLSTLTHIWLSTFSNRPSQLFAGAQKRLTIAVGKKGKSTSTTVFTTAYERWRTEERHNLFPARVYYVQRPDFFQVFPQSLEKIGSQTQIDAFTKMIKCAQNIQFSLSANPTKYELFYTRKFGYFLAFLDFVPKLSNEKTGKSQTPSELKSFFFSSKEHLYCAIAAYSSSSYFWFWNCLSDCRNLNKRDLFALPFDPNKKSKQFLESLSLLGCEYLRGLRTSSRTMLKSGLKIETFEYPAQKPIIDQIDSLLAQHYGFTQSELDFIINYDIKYRMGKELGGTDSGEDSE